MSERGLRTRRRKWRLAPIWCVSSCSSHFHLHEIWILVLLLLLGLVMMFECCFRQGDGEGDRERLQWFVMKTGSREGSIDHNEVWEGMRTSTWLWGRPKVRSGILKRRKNANKLPSQIPVKFDGRSMDSWWVMVRHKGRSNSPSSFFFFFMVDCCLINLCEKGIGEWKVRRRSFWGLILD